MVKNLNRMSIFVFVIFLVGFSVMVSGCFEDLSLNSISTEEAEGEFVSSDIGKIKISTDNDLRLPFQAIVKNFDRLMSLMRIERYDGEDLTLSQYRPLSIVFPGGT